MDNDATTHVDINNFFTSNYSEWGAAVILHELLLKLVVALQLNKISKYYFTLLLCCFSGYLFALFFKSFPLDGQRNIYFAVVNCNLNSLKVRLSQNEFMKSFSNIATEKFEGFLPLPLKRGQIKNFFIFLNMKLLLRL